jgi:hypothetical protein
MGFGNKDILISRVIDGNDFLNEIDPAKITELEAEVSDYIFQQTGIVPPEDAAQASPTLRGVWADIVLFKSIKWQKSISDEEVKRRTILKDDAERLLNKIASGDFTIKNSADETSVEVCPIVITGSKRIITP